MSVAVPVDQSAEVEQDQVQPRPDQARPDQSLAGGRLRQEALPDSDRIYTIWLHLSLFATPIMFPLGCVAPIILWLIRREKSTFVNDHGAEAANLVITGAIATLALGLIPVAGWVVLVAWYIVAGISVVRGALAANRGEFFRYPMVVRVLS